MLLAEPWLTVSACARCLGLPPNETAGPDWRKPAVLLCLGRGIEKIAPGREGFQSVGTLTEPTQ